MTPGFTLGSKVMRIADNHLGWEVQHFTPSGWEVWKDGFDTIEEATAFKCNLEMKAASVGTIIEFRVYESVY